MKTVGVVLGPSNFKADVKCALSDLSKRKEINLPFVLLQRWRLDLGATCQFNEFKFTSVTLIKDSS